MTGFEKYREEVERFKRSDRYDREFKLFLDVLKRLDGRYITAEDFKRIYDIPSVRLRTLVKNGRRMGYWIVSDQNGYKLTDNYFEMQETIKHLEERVSSLQFTLECIKKGTVYGK